MHVRGGRGPLQDIFLCYIFFYFKEVNSSVTLFFDFFGIYS